jgi:hypothetical protein
MMTSRSDPDADRSIGVLLADLASEAALLLRQEIRLLKAELQLQLSRQARAGIMLAAGGLILFSGWLVLLAAATLGLSSVIAPWLAALLIALVTLFIGFVLVRFGMRRLSPDALVPHRTIGTLRDDAQWLKGRLP